MSSSINDPLAPQQPWESNDEHHEHQPQQDDEHPPPPPPPPPPLEDEQQAQNNNNNNNGEEDGEEDEPDYYPVAAEKVKEGELDLKTSLFGADIHQQSLVHVAKITIVVTVLSSFVLLAGSIWGLGEVSSAQGTSCCLSMACNASGEDLLPLDSASRVWETNPVPADNGLCRFIQPDVARRMNCLIQQAALTTSSSNSNSNGSCAVRVPSECRGRSEFPTELGVWSASLGFAAVGCCLLLVVVICTDIAASSSALRFALLALLVLFVLGFSGAGIGCVATPLDTALRGRGVEMEAATARQGTNPAYLTATHVGFSPMYFNEHCGVESKKRAQIVAFQSSVDPRALIVLLVGHGLCFFMTCCCLALTWQSGGFLHALLARDSREQDKKAEQQQQQTLQEKHKQLQQQQAEQGDRALREHLLLQKIERERHRASEQREMQYRRLHPHEELEYSPPAHRASSSSSSVPRPQRQTRSSSSLQRDNVHPRLTDDELLIRMRIASTTPSGRSDGSPGWLNNSQPPLQVDARGRMLI